MQIINLIKIILVEIYYIIKKKTYKFRAFSKKDESIFQELQEKGIYICKEFLSKDEVDRLIREASSTKKKYKKNIIFESKGADQRIYGIDLINKEFNLDKFTHLEHIPWRFYGTKAIEKFILYGEIFAAEENLGSGNGWHKDSAFRPQIKFLIYLTDVGIENGPFEYIEGTHTLKSTLKLCQKSSISKTRYDDKEIGILVKERKINASRKILGSAGDLIIVNTRGLHRGAPLIKGDRKAITAYIFDGKIPKSIPLAKL